MHRYPSNVSHSSIPFKYGNNDKSIQPYFKTGSYIQVGDQIRDRIYNSTVQNQISYTSLSIPIPDELFDITHSEVVNSSKTDESKDKFNSYSHSLSPEDLDYSNTILDLRSNLIETQFASSNEIENRDLSDTSTIYSDDTYNESDSEGSNLGITKRDVINYLYPKYVYSYSNDVSFDDSPSMSYCRKPIMVDDRGSWHYECPKVDIFQNQLVNKIKEWNIYKEEVKEIMLKKSSTLNSSQSSQEIQNTIDSPIVTDTNVTTNVTNPAVSVPSVNNVTTTNVNNVNTDQNPKKQRRRRNHLALCEIKCDGRESSGGYVLRKKNLIGMSPLEAFDNNWAYEKILRDIKKQSKYEKNKANQIDANNSKVRIGRPPKEVVKPESGIFPSGSRKIKRFYIPVSESSHILDYRNKKVKECDYSEPSKITLNEYPEDSNTCNFIPNDIKSFGTRSPIIKTEGNFPKNLSDIHKDRPIKVNEIHKYDGGYFTMYGSCDSEINASDGILDSLFKRTHRSRKPPSFYDCYIPLDVNE